MSFGGSPPPIPPINAPLPTPGAEETPPGRSSEEVQAAARLERARRAAAQGRTSTILGGTAGPNPPFRAGLLGG